MREGDAILIAAQSGRALAQAARRAGLRPFVLDLFGDEDTLALAEAHRPLPGRFGTSRLGSAAVLAGLEELNALASGTDSSVGRSCPVLGVVLGSGFEGAPELIARIAERHRLIGADAGTVATLKDPFAFAALCARLEISHPAVTADRPAKPGDWLLKRVGGSGGSHIRAATAQAPPPGHYCQARVPGRSHALNVLADGRAIGVLALTAQWTAPSALRPFRYAGALARGRSEPPAIPPATLEAITESIHRLVVVTGLRGLASADVLVDGADWWLLEINPRPGATLDVLDRRASPLLALHIEASLGQLPRLDAPPADAAGSEICYAPRRYDCMRPLDWPGFVADRPRGGSRVARDAPLCTATAQGPTVAAVRKSLLERARTVRALIDGSEDIHGDRHQAAEHQRAHGTAR